MTDFTLVARSADDRHGLRLKQVRQHFAPSDAILTARANVAANGAADIVTVGGPELVAGRVADVLVANILLEPLLGLAPRFAALLHPGGHIALTGLLADQATTVIAAYAADFDLAVSAARGEWVLLAGRRRR